MTTRLKLSSLIPNSDKHFVFVDLNDNLCRATKIKRVARKFNIGSFQLWISNRGKGNYRYLLTSFEPVEFNSLKLINVNLSADKRFISNLEENKEAILRLANNERKPLLSKVYRFDWGNKTNIQAFLEFKKLLEESIANVK